MAVVRRACLVVVALTVLPACASPKPDDPQSVGCEPASGTVLSALRKHIEKDGTLRHGAILLGARGAAFVSAELHLVDDDEDDQGAILTWTTPDPASGTFFAVDQRAREDSSWPHADIDMRAVGAIASRGCTAEYRQD